MSELAAPAAAAGAGSAARSPLTTGLSAPPRARGRPPAWLLTAALGVVYLIIAPASPDLAAASYRSWLFAHFGFQLWDNSWYGGHHLLAYSLLAPALSALIGPRVLAALSMTIATALFERLIRPSFPARASAIAALWFAIGASVGLLSSRVPFDLGLALGLAAALLARRALGADGERGGGSARRPGALLRARRARAHTAPAGRAGRGALAGALVLAATCSLASPVAGAFLALAMLACALAGRARTRASALTLAALAPIALLAFVFPEGGDQPFVASAFYPALLGVLVIAALVPREQRILRTGTALYALVLIGAYLVPSAVGGNADRLGSLAAGPVAACVLAGGGRLRGPAAGARRTRLLALLAPVLLYWQVNAPAADFAAASSNPSVNASYYAPLLRELRALGIGYGARPARIEVVPTAAHWEARWVAPHVTLARGWERQLDSYRNSLFYGAGAHVTAARYRAWLLEQAISYVALPDAKLDYSATAEARLLRGGAPPYLREVWRSAHWRLFAVRDPQALAQAPARVQQLGVDSLTLWAPRPGSYTVRVRFTPYWAITAGAGCVAPGGGQWTQIRARRAGELRLAIRFSLTRIFERGRRCT